MELVELLQRNENLDNYIEEFSTNKDFLIYYYLQNPSRIETNFGTYAKYIPTRDKIDLLRKLATNNVNNRLFCKAFYYTIVYSTDDMDIIDSFAEELINKAKNNEFSFDGLEEIITFFIRIDPVYFLKKDINNVSKLRVVDDNLKVEDSLNYLRDNNFNFSIENKSFINNLFNNTNNLIDFINTCRFDDNVSALISDKFSSIPKEELFSIYNQINNEYLRKSIRVFLNYNNFDINTLIKDKKIFLRYDNNKEEIVNFIKNVKDNNLDLDIVIIMNRVDLDFSEELYDLYGERLRISPIENQLNKPNDIWSYPDFSFDYIKKCELKIDSYVECVHDCYDKNGDIKSLSPFEKYIAAYILTCRFGRYEKESPKEGYELSRSLYEVVGQEEDLKIVCAGYVKLLREMLYRMGIKDSIEWDVYAPSEGPLGPSTSNHSRMVVHLVDPKYNIDGIYMADPTWDSHSLDKHRYEHMLMSEEELFKIDSELNPDYLRLKDLCYEGDKLNVESLSSLFNNTIPKDVIIKGFLAVNRFLDKNMTMAKSDDDYSRLEYDEMAKQLGIGNNLTVDNKQLLQMTGEELKYASEVYDSQLIYELRSMFSEFLQSNGVERKVGLTPTGAYIRLDDRVPYELLEQYGFMIDQEKQRLYLYSYSNDRTFSEKSVSEFFGYMLNRINEYEKLVNNLSNDNEVKSK